MHQCRVAGAENLERRAFYAQLGFQRGGDVHLGQDTEALAGQRRSDFQLGAGQVPRHGRFD
jgi:hypothetical protein